MSFMCFSKYKHNLSNIDQSLDKIDNSLYLILEEIEENDSNEETQLLKNQIEERIEAIGNNKEEIYELFEIMIKKNKNYKKNQSNKNNKNNLS